MDIVKIDLMSDKILVERRVECIERHDGKVVGGKSKCCGHSQFHFNSNQSSRY